SLGDIRGGGVGADDRGRGHRHGSTLGDNDRRGERCPCPGGSRNEDQEDGGYADEDARSHRRLFLSIGSAYALISLLHRILWWGRTLVNPAKCLRIMLTERRSVASKSPLPWARRQRGSRQRSRIRRRPPSALPTRL